MPVPMSHSELMRVCGNNDGDFYMEQIIPGMYHDLLGRIYHRDSKLQGIEIIHEEERRRFDSAMMFLFSILTSCTALPHFDGVMDRERAREAKNVPLIYRFLKDYFVLVNCTSITQKMLKVCSNCLNWTPRPSSIIVLIQLLY